MCIWIANLFIVELRYAEELELLLSAYSLSELEWASGSLQYT